jgi:hypothetical protein
VSCILELYEREHTRPTMIRTFQLFSYRSAMVWIRS